ncbi:MAG: PAS domain S-box protein, partial [Candidatus Electrothrix sp. AUS4]|nr:PAS domain S-box protein [Candidatus Electrothrix sp. AUS4]
KKRSFSTLYQDLLWQLKGVIEADFKLIVQAEQMEEYREELEALVENSRMLEKNLQYEKDFLGTVLNTIEDGIIACDQEGALTLFNRAAQSFHGVLKAQLPIEKWSYDMYLADGMTPMETKDIPLLRALQGENVRHLEMVLAPKENKKRVLRAAGLPLYDHQGNKLGAVVSLHDITERKRAEHDLQIAQSQLLHAEKLSAIGSLSASIAHEFNNPLQGVLNILKGVARRAVMDEEDKALMAAAVNECNRMRDLIKSLQDFNRPTSGRKAPMDIHAALDSLLLLTEKEFKERKVTVKKQYAQHIPQILAVSDQIKQVFLNLLSNSADACREDGGVITIETVAAGDRVLIRIHDTGIGIPPENKEKIFEPFFTTKPAIKGTGLGLSVSFGIIRSHGGTIEVDSTPGEGTIFVVTLPVNV